MNNKGVSYALFKDSLVPIEFNPVFYNEEFSEQFKIYNGCKYDVKVALDIVRYVGKKCIIMKDFSVVPKIINIFGNEGQNMSFNTYTIKGLIEYEYGDNISKILDDIKDNPYECSVRMSIVDGPEYTVPLSYYISVKSLKVIDIRRCMSETGNIDYDNESTVDVIDCGEKDMLVNVHYKLVLYNPGNIKIPFNIKTTNKNIFSLSVENGYINGKEHLKFDLIFKKYNFNDDEDIPQSIECIDNLLVICNNDKRFPYISIPVKGILVDNAEPISFPDPFEFPKAFKGMISYKILEWRNPLRRPINYRFIIAREYSDIFKVAESKFSDDFTNEVDGTIGARALCQMRLAFIPIINTQYKGTALLETEEGSFSIELLGNSENPKILINRSKVSFKNVKINLEKSETILISCGCSIPFTLNINYTNQTFYSKESTITLIPKEHIDLKIYFRPVSDKKESGELQFTYYNEIEKEQKVITSIKLYGNESISREKSYHTSSSEGPSSRSSHKTSAHSSNGEIIETTTSSESEEDKTDSENQKSPYYNDSTENESSENSFVESTDEKIEDRPISKHSQKSKINNNDEDYNEDTTSKPNIYETSRKSSRSHHSRHSEYSHHDIDKDNEKHEYKEKEKYKFDGTEEKIVFYNRKYEKLDENKFKIGYKMSPEQVKLFRENHTQKSLDELQDIMNNIFFLNDVDESKIPFDEILEKYRKGELTKNTLIGNEGEIYRSKSKLYVDNKGRIIDVNNIQNMELKFPHIKKHHTVKKQIEYENIGSHTVEMQAFDENGDPIKPGQELISKNKNVKYRISPSSSKIRPNSSEAFTISVEGIDIGNDKFNISLETKTKNPKRVNILSLVSVIPDLSEERMNALKNYSKVDQSVESKLMLPSPHNDELLKDELWKVLYPIIRVKMTKPSEEYYYIPYLEPIISEIDMSQLIQRPLAIPREIKKQRPVWYSNKIFMSFDHKENDSIPLTEKKIREDNAEKFVKQIEKKAIILKKRK
ncbi:hypothetical protein BCR32DRAFT_8582 [Anaeromyces robustus]|uniref:Uncharacterized protein n=1 Tax=Anaeromyces robustus TaxID=1754192 RepID=A0A1Y1X8J8_9FUNG|nr:hypothetical protein BCR32DRAFT_8582 [Anaeromyces robustus]|eukprot:ORX81746.1 hypothetical protein BCR32DRAFT_8582 [Anaeromyces robustus]